MDRLDVLGKDLWKSIAQKWMFAWVATFSLGLLCVASFLWHRVDAHCAQPWHGETGVVLEQLTHSVKEIDHTLDDVQRCVFELVGELKKSNGH